MRKIFTLLILALGSLQLMAQETNFWVPADEVTTTKNVFGNRSKPASFKLFRLKESDFVIATRNTVSERSVNAAQSATIVSFPDAEGKIQRFRIVQAPVMDAALSARYPGIYSYSGKGVDDPSLTVRFSVSSLGVYGMILSPTKPTVYIDPLDRKGQYYMAVSRKDLGGTDKFQCLTEELGTNNRTAQTLTSSEALRNADDGKMRIYDLALCASGEYSQFWLDGTETSDAQRKAKVLAALNNAMTRTNGIYERDFGIRMVLVANNDAVIFLNPSTDPFTTSSSWGNQSQATCDTYIGSGNYDIGHSITYSAPPGNGNAGCIGCVCTASTKGKGWTAYYDFASDYFVVDYLTHEMGHQFGGNHTFTFSSESTIAQVEPGSGSTIMGYAGITGSTDVQPHSDDYFHAISIQQITNYIKSASSSCDVEQSTGNNIPVANAGADYVIPRSTPFKLTGSGSDADASDVLNYCWEQMDVRGTGSSTIPSATATSGPQFRSYLPGTSTSRTIPEINSILNGSNSNKWEVLPSVARTLNFRFTTRDNHPGGGANKSDDMVLTISGTTGPFAVTSPNTNVTWGAGTNQTVTWSVNGTNGSPVNCTNVNILLSTDGGNNFSMLLANTPNDGSESVTVPNILGTANRIKVEAVGNIFFDISNTNFTIGTPPACGDPTGLTSTSVTSSSASVNWNSVPGAINYDVDYRQSPNGTWNNAATGTTSLSVNLSGLSASTTYDWRVRANCTAGVGNYVTAQFTTTAVGGSCPGPYDISTNGTISGAATIPSNTDILGIISPRGDNDYYRVNIVTGGTINITLTNLVTNYQLALLNSSGTQIAISQNNGTISEGISTTVSSGTTYYVRVFPKGSASSATACYTLRVGGVSTSSRGGDEIITSNDRLINLFPNPANNKLSVTINNLLQNTTLSIYNVTGKLVLQQRTNEIVTELNIAKLPAGVYLMNVTDAEGVRSMKFVKQ